MLDRYGYFLRESKIPCYVAYGTCFCIILGVLTAIGKAIWDNGWYGLAVVGIILGVVAAIVFLASVAYVMEENRWWNK